MIQFPSHITLTARSFSYLATWQKLIDDEPTYQAQLEKVKDKFWGSKSATNTIKEVRTKLQSASNSANRCHYCEDSEANQIEHFYPKSIYPEKTFVWENYFYACSLCNGAKSNQFAHISNQNTLEHIIKTEPPIHPNNINPTALINPRIENPFDFLALNIEFDFIRNSPPTFTFFPTHTSSDFQRVKAKYTIKTLNLNRGALINSREKAYNNFRAKLKEYISETGNIEAQIRLIADIKDDNHQAVWYEMKRSREYIPELNALFTQAPEALIW